MDSSQLARELRIAANEVGFDLAGIGPAVTPEGVRRLDAWLEAFSVHLDEPFFLTQELTPSLKRASGQVITLLDASAGSGMLSRAAYSLSKLSLENFTTFAAKALGPKIRVNGLKLGPTLPADGMPKKELNQLDWGDPDHAVAALVALAKDKNSTGKIFQVDDF